LLYYKLTCVSAGGANMNGECIDKNNKTTKEKILDAAIDLFSQRGYTGVSIRDITRHVGIKESSLYNHFKSKDELMGVIYDIFQRELGEKSFPEDNIEEIIVNLTPEMFLIHNIMKFKERLTPFLEKVWRIIYMEQFRDDRAREFFTGELNKRPQKFYESVFRTMINKGMIKPLDPRILAYQYNYPLTMMAMEYIILKYDNKDVTYIGRQMIEHTRAFADMIKI
jgi:AcrR family transcriptional regulator